MNDDRVVESYRAHQLVAVKRVSGYEGVVWKGKNKLHSNFGTSFNDVLQRLRNYVDARLDEIAKSRTVPPKGEEYAAALQKILGSLSDGQRAMLKAHYLAPEQLISTTGLAAAAGYPNYNSANLQYGFVGKALYDELPVVLDKMADGTPVYTSALATEGPRPVSEEHWCWKLRPEVAYAIERVGLAKAK